MLGIAAGREMKIGIVTGDADSVAGVALDLLRELLKAVENLLGYQVALFNPAFGAGRGANPGEAAVALQNVNPVAIFYRSGLVVNSGDAVAEKGLRGRDIVGFEDSASAPSAPGQQQDRTEQQRPNAPSKIHGNHKYYSAGDKKGSDG